MNTRTKAAITLGAALLSGAMILPAYQASAQTTPFTPPTAVLAPTMTGNGPAQMWMYPNDPAKVVKQLMTWLSEATPTTVVLPKPLHSLHFEDYMGPTQVYFTNQNRQQVTLAPVYYIAHGRQGYHPAYIADDLTYKVDGHTEDIRSPGLFAWLTHNNEGQAAFRDEAFTPAQQAALHAVFTSQSGRALAGQFPSLPGIETHALPKALATVGAAGTPATFATLINQTGKKQTVVLIEVSANGSRQKAFSYTVNAHGSVTGSSR